MPRPGPAKPTITIRLHQSGIDRLDQLAAQKNLTRSELVRRILSQALSPETPPDRMANHRAQPSAPPPGEVA